MSGSCRLQEPGHHLDAGERVLDLVRDRRGHLAERGQPIAQPLALFELLDVRQVLEEQRRADRSRPRSSLHLRQRVADHLVGALQPQLGAVRQVRQLERAAQRPGRRRAGPGAPRRTAGRYRRPPASGRRSGSASSFITAIRPSRVIASTPLRMLPDQVAEETSSDDRRSGRRRRAARARRRVCVDAQVRLGASVMPDAIIVSRACTGQTTCPARPCDYDEIRDYQQHCRMTECQLDV